MRKRILRLIALVLACTLLTGCGENLKIYTESLISFLSGQTSGDVVAYEDMTYTRPDMEALEATLADVLDAAAGEDFDEIIDGIWEFYDAYDLFFTHYALADIRYSGDLTDSYWEAEYDFCSENSPRVSAMLDELYYGLAKSPCLEKLEGDAYFGEGYFDSYQGENNWDEEFTSLLEQESNLISRYYEISRVAGEYETGSEEYYDVCFADAAQLLVELILLRHDIAAYWGYDDYAQFATDYYHYRDYTMDESRAYLDQVRTELVDLYRQMNTSGIWETAFADTTEAETYAYVAKMAEAMGGTVQEAFEVMDQGKLYDIGYGKNKYPSSFEIYLPSFYVPFIFMCPEGTTYDHLTFAHEFGHFCNDYASYQSFAGVDVLEFFSQGMEYLSLCYGSGTNHLTKIKMADSLCLYVEQSAFASFEMRMYEIPREELSVEALTGLYEQVATEYAFESIGYDPREFVSINHYYTNPLYILSYVVSNDAAMQLYQLEKNRPGSGLAVLEKNLATGEYYFLSFLESAGLESPFAEGRLQRVRETFEEVLG